MIENFKYAVLSDNLKRILKYFNEISEIPRPTWGEEKIRQYLIGVAVQHDWQYLVDKAGNISVEIPPSRGRENETLVILQSHIDMVTTGGNDKNPTVARIKKGWLTSDEKTTLGADNGIGVSLALALATSTDHGPLTLLFTVEEEVGMGGATRLSKNILPKAEKIILINIDAEEGADLICKGCSGAVGIVGELGLKRVPIKDDEIVLEIEVSGLPGGHSGIDIFQVPENAFATLNLLLQRIKIDLNWDTLKVVSFEGGNARNAIPTSARARVAVTLEQVAALKTYLEYTNKSSKEGNVGLRVGANAAKNFVIRVTEVGIGAKFGAIKQFETIQGVIDTVCTVPLLMRENGLLDEVEASHNLGIIREKNNVLEMLIFARAVQPFLDEREALLVRILQKAGMVVRFEDKYNGWIEDENGAAIQALVQSVKTVLGKDAGIFAYHAALECGIIVDVLKDANPGAEISTVAYGPLTLGAHTIYERVNLKSVEEVYEVLRLMVNTH